MNESQWIQKHLPCMREANPKPRELIRHALKVKKRPEVVYAMGVLLTLGGESGLCVEFQAPEGKMVKVKTLNQLVNGMISRATMTLYCVMKDPPSGSMATLMRDHIRNWLKEESGCQDADGGEEKWAMVYGMISPDMAEEKTMLKDLKTMLHSRMQMYALGASSKALETLEKAIVAAVHRLPASCSTEKMVLLGYLR
uniref:M1 n=13 Tax=Isavirus salaris TaxID=55987 RepID=Q1L5K3_9ORTO|nr:non-structural protein 2 [Infectious salmon anemia virus]ABG65853.1 matrix protein [Isavirus salaris]AAY52778.1 non-structural protein 2 [Infectious salmon anemia virus]AAY52782.1 non-structural protein 2 [Infectious salmon anemia virus]AAY85937.1 nonstructural protein 1 [Infectious salmon anemia virus]